MAPLKKRLGTPGLKQKIFNDSQLNLQSNERMIGLHSVASLSLSSLQTKKYMAMISSEHEIGRAHV